MRAASCRSHERRGFADAADWLARASGTARGDAKAAMETAAAVDRETATGAAMAAGELSLGQAQLITRTEAECPGSSSDLLELAGKSSLATLRDEARRRCLAAADPEDLHRRQHKAREFRHWRDDLGMVRLAGALPPELGVPIMNRLDAETDRIRRAAAAEEPELRAAHAADAFVAMLSGHSSGKGSSTDLVLVCSLDAYRRGCTEPGETCHIVGGGPLPVSVARRLGADAFLKAVLHDGVRIETVAHFGRHIPAELRTALELGPPPAFDGVVCVEEACGRQYGLEWDHVDPVANGGATSYENLQARCWPHHRAKTERDRRAGLLRAPP
ncbi:MAG: HNH endonuclease [Actinomycetota bacterium]|nr:HNH endonuclease [Actinomycetota bacterium]